MTEPGCGINSVADKRYYHFVVFRGSGVSLATYWKRLHEVGHVLRPKVSVPLESNRFTLEHRKLRSDRAYARGEAAQSLSERGNGRPPFFYDLFASRIQFRDDVYVLLGFPFAAFALETLDYLIEDQFFQHAQFQAAELSKLLSEKNRPLQRFEGLSSRVVGVQFVVTDDKSLTAVRLGGDDPFHAQIYESFLKKKFEQELWVPDQCVLACERETEEPRSSAGILRSRLHIDKSGNFKFYMHAGCSNVALMPCAIAQIRAVASLKQVFGNPLRRIEEPN